MDRLEHIKKLNDILLSEMPMYRESAAGFGDSIPQQRRLLRSLMNLRREGPLSEEYTALQDALLSAEREEKGVKDIREIPHIRPRIRLWRGDITRLAADAVVNAANSALLGCFYPCHGCIDNAIHSAAGLQLREECAEIMKKQGHDEPVGGAKITSAYNLPSRYVIHTVGPFVSGGLTDEHCAQLYSCYNSCLKLAESRSLSSIAFCCISTGEFHFPADAAAQTAVRAVSDFLKVNDGIEVIFNVFRESDEDIYRQLLSADRNA